MLLFSLHNIAMYNKMRPYCIQHIFFRIAVFKIQYVCILRNVQGATSVQASRKIFVVVRGKVRQPSCLGVHSHILEYVRSEVTQVIHVVDIYGINFSSPTLQVLWGQKHILKIKFLCQSVLMLEWL